jgi:hypothetical protein
MTIRSSKDRIVTTTPKKPIYDVAIYRPGIYTATQLLVKVMFVCEAIYPVALLDSEGRLDVAATAQTDFDLQKNGVSFGTCRVAAAAVDATFISASGVTFAAGDYYEVYAPGTADATAAGLSLTLKGTR